MPPTIKCLALQLAVASTCLIHMALCDRGIDPKFLDFDAGDFTGHLTSKSVPHITSNKPIDPNSVIVIPPRSSSSSSPLVSSTRIIQILAAWMFSLCFIRVALFLVLKCLYRAKLYLANVHKNKENSIKSSNKSIRSNRSKGSSISPSLYSMLSRFSKSTAPVSNGGVLKNRRTSVATSSSFGSLAGLLSTGSDGASGYSEGSSAFLDYSSANESEVVLEGGGGDDARSKQSASFASSSAFSYGASSAGGMSMGTSVGTSVGGSFPGASSVASSTVCTSMGGGSSVAQSSVASSACETTASSRFLGVLVSNREKLFNSSAWTGYHSSSGYNSSHARRSPTASPNSGKRTSLDILPQRSLSCSPNISKVANNYTLPSDLNPSAQGEFRRRPQYYATGQDIEKGGSKYYKASLLSNNVANKPTIQQQNDREIILQNLILGSACQNSIQNTTYNQQQETIAETLPKIRENFSTTLNDNQQNAPKLNDWLQSHNKSYNSYDPSSDGGSMSDVDLSSTSMLLRPDIQIFETV